MISWHRLHRFKYIILVFHLESIAHFCPCYLAEVPLWQARVKLHMQKFCWVNGIFWYFSLFVSHHLHNELLSKEVETVKFQHFMVHIFKNVYECVFIQIPR